MPQMIYSVAAIFLLGIAFLNVNQKVHGTESRMMFSELALEMTGVGTQLLDEINKYPFDAGTLAGLAVDRAALSAAATWGTSPCNLNNANFQGCATISDFHGTTGVRNKTRVRSGSTYTVPYNITGVTVRYVTETAPHVASATATFAKEVTLTVSTPALVDGTGAPIAIQMRRVYMYPNL